MFKKLIFLFFWFFVWVNGNLVNQPFTPLFSILSSSSTVTWKIKQNLFWIYLNQRKISKFQSLPFNQIQIKTLISIFLISLHSHKEIKIDRQVKPLFHHFFLNFMAFSNFSFIIFEWIWNFKTRKLSKNYLKIVFTKAEQKVWSWRKFASACFLVHNFSYLRLPGWLN